MIYIISAWVLIGIVVACFSIRRVPKQRHTWLTLLMLGLLWPLAFVGAGLEMFDKPSDEGF
jgi:hypothetical protein